MPKHVLRGLSIVLGVLFLFGCTATKNVEIRRYVEVKDRIDQNMEGGNAGFLAGTPQPEDRSGIRKTRKTYVVEVSKGDLEEREEVVVIEGDDAFMDESDYEEEDMGYPSDGSVEDYDEGLSFDTDAGDDAGSGSAGASGSIVEYTVQKDDTMQKISKKFYDSFSKWPKIYEANKDVITNPDRIKPGIVIQIPME